MAAETIQTADVSVIMPAFNAAATIERAVLSAVRQTIRPREIIICDDGSSDGTTDIVRRMGPELDGVRLLLLTQPNKGAGAARNHAISKATSEWLAFLDADDEWLESKLEVSLDVISRGRHLLVAHNYVALAGDGSEQLVDCARRFQAHGANPDGLYRYGFICTSSVVVKRQAVAGAGGFDETLATAQDFDLWLKVLRPDDASYTVFDAALLRYSANPSGITSQTRRRLDCTMRVAKRHNPGTASLLFRITAVHYEAFNAYRQSGRYDKALWICVLMAGRLIVAVLDAAIPDPVQRGLCRAAMPLLWVWLVVAFGAYLYRFNHLIVAFYQLVTGL